MNFTIQNVVIAVEDGYAKVDSQWETNRKSQTVSQIEAHYRTVMGL